jgi:hypothetical protein
MHGSLLSLQGDDTIEPVLELQGTPPCHVGEHSRARP